MRYRVFAFVFLAVLCGSALYAQLPERVTFQPATFGHATYYGYYNANVGGADKMTYANTNLAQRNSSRGSVVVRPYGVEPTKIVGYSQPEYRPRVVRPARAGRVYTPVTIDDCLCGSGGQIEMPQTTSQVKPEVEIKVPLENKPIVPPVVIVGPEVEAPITIERPVTPVIPPPTVIVPEPSLLDQLTENSDDQFGGIEIIDEDDDPFGDDDNGFDPFAPAGPTVPVPANSTFDDDDDPFGGIEIIDEDDDPFGDDDNGFDPFIPTGPTVPVPANSTFDDNDDPFGGIEIINEDDDPFGDDDNGFDPFVPAGPTVPVPANNTFDDDDDPFGDGFSFDDDDDLLEPTSGNSVFDGDDDDGFDLFDFGDDDDAPF